jgi:hypothetical protein
VVEAEVVALLEVVGGGEDGGAGGAGGVGGGVGGEGGQLACGASIKKTASSAPRSSASPRCIVRYTCGVGDRISKKGCVASSAGINTRSKTCLTSAPARYSELREASRRHVRTASPSKRTVFRSRSVSRGAAAAAGAASGSGDDDDDEDATAGAAARAAVGAAAGAAAAGAAAAVGGAVALEAVDPPGAGAMGAGVGGASLSVVGSSVMESMLTPMANGLACHRMGGRQGRGRHRAGELLLALEGRGCSPE